MTKFKREPIKCVDEMGVFYRVPLAGGAGEALVDEGDLSRIGRAYYRNTDGYACRGTKKNKRSDGKTITFFMHKEITGWDEFTDHKDGNPANNRRHNLRRCTLSQNQWNKKKCAKKTSSQYKGVSYFKQKKDPKKWRATIWKNREKFFLGYFSEERDAAMAYDTAAKKLFGAFARPNL